MEGLGGKSPYRGENGGKGSKEKGRGVGERRSLGKEGASPSLFPCQRPAVIDGGHVWCLAGLGSDAFGYDCPRSATLEKVLWLTRG